MLAGAAQGTPKLILLQKDNTTVGESGKKRLDQPPCPYQDGAKR